MPADSARGAAPRLDQPRRIHIIGIGGAGMSAVASVLAAMGHRVTGSDLKASPVTERLAAEGITVSIGHRAEQLGDAELVTASPAVRPENPEMAAAVARGVPVASRSEVLRAISRLRRCIAVAGTHGKTTTCSMLALVLVEAGARPSFLIGADVNDIGTNAVWGEGPWLVLEADESFGTFQSLEPEVAVVTSVEPDHLDHYGTFAGLREAFERFAAGAGRRVVSADDPVVAELGRRLGARRVGLSEEADVRMVDVATSRSSVSFDLVAGEPLGHIEVPVAGLHNARNAALAAVAGLEAGASFEAVAAALARFAGVPRRFEFRGEAGGVTFVDDYAHLPGEVTATLTAAAEGGWGRVIAVFQPHRYSRTAALASSFAGAFDRADAVVVTDVYGAGEAPVPGVSGRLVAEAVAATPGGPSVTYAAGRDELRREVGGLLRPGDLCLTLGAGDLTTLPDELLAAPTW